MTPAEELQRLVSEIGIVAQTLRAVADEAARLVQAIDANVAGKASEPRGFSPHSEHTSLPTPSSEDGKALKAIDDAVRYVWLSPSQHKMLQVIAQHPMGLDKAKLAALLGQVPDSPAFKRNLTKLRWQGCVTKGKKIAIIKDLVK